MHKNVLKKDFLKAHMNTVKLWTGLNSIIYSPQDCGICSWYVHAIVCSNQNTFSLGTSLKTLNLLVHSCIYVAIHHPCASAT